MAYVYIYIDISVNDPSIVYVGKITRLRQTQWEALRARHKEHKNDSWYKGIGDENLCLEFFEVDSDVDADILEDYYIAMCDSEKLCNKAKRWGKSTLKINHMHRWRTIESFLQADYMKAASTIVDMVCEHATEGKHQSCSKESFAERAKRNTEEYLGEAYKYKRLRELMNNKEVRSKFVKKYQFMC